MEVRTKSCSPTLASIRQEQLVRTLPILVIHAHGSCNCRCVMCDIWKTRENKTFSVRDLERQLDSIRRLEVRWVVFSGGEPLMNPELPKICELLRQEGIRLTLLSTGLLLKKHSDEVAGSFDDVIVSLDGPRAIHDKIRRVEGAFDLLQSGILALRQVRPDIRITARSTVQKMNHRYLVETARAAEQMQLDGISFLAVDVSSPAFNRSLVWPTELQAEVALSIQGLSALETAIEELIYCAENEFRAGFVAESPQKLRRILRHFSAELGLEPRESPTCNAPWVSSVLEVDGTVRPCFFHPAIGNLQNSTLEKVINSQTALDFRSNLDIPSNSVCQKCVCSLNYRR